MAAINTSISYQSQFAPSNRSINETRTKSGAQSQMEEMKGVSLKPTSTQFKIQTVVPMGDVGMHVNLKA
jgi:hypothetical protein